MLRSSRLFAAVAVGVLLSACSGSDHGPFEPLPGGATIPVTLETTASPAGASVSQVAFATASGGVTATWDVTSGPCLVATATALQSGAVVEIRIHRSGDPSALCVAMAVTYRYVAHVPLVPGAYEIRLVDDMLGQQLRPVGRSMITVTR